MYILNLCTLISHSPSFSTVLCANDSLVTYEEGGRLHLIYALSRRESRARVWLRETKSCDYRYDDDGWGKMCFPFPTRHAPLPTFPGRV